MKREGFDGLRWSAATLLAAALTLTAMCASAQGIKDLLSKAFGSHMNDIAQKIAELPDPTLGFASDHLQFSPDGSVLASLVDDKINIWDWKNRRVLRTLRVPSVLGITLAPLSFSPDGRFFAFCANGWEHSGRG